MVQWFFSGLPRLVGGVPVLAIPAIIVFLIFLLALLVHRWYALHLDRYRASPDYAIAQLAQRTRDFGVSFHELSFGRLLGKGSQGEVFEAQWRGLSVAVKRVDTRTVAAETIDEFVAEADIMRRLRHPAITLFMGLSLDTNSLCIVTELVSRGSLFDLLQDSELSGITWKRALQIAVDIAAGMTYLHGHSPPILHRDLKSLNILVTALWRGKVADFGMTRFQQDPKEEKSMTQCLESSTRILLADGSVRALCDPAVKIGTMLAGEQGPVRIISKRESTSPRMLTITHADGFAYTVTPNHLVTLRWTAGPQTIVHTAVDGARSVEMVWWQFDGKSFEQKRTTQRHCPATAGLADDDLRPQARTEWDESRLAGGDGWRALFAGDLIDITAETLAIPEVWSLLFPPTSSPLATSRRISMPPAAMDPEERIGERQPLRSIPIGVVSAATVVDHRALHLRSVTQPDGTRGFTYSGVQPGDAVQLLLVLPSPSSLLSDRCGRKSISLLNLERIFNSLRVRPGTDVHVIATSLQCIAEDLSSLLPSNPADSLCHIRDHQHAMLQHLGASQLVVFGALNTFYWRSVAAVRGVSDVRHATNADGLMRTTFSFTPDGSLSAPRHITVLYAADLSMGTYTPEIAPVIAAALGLTLNASSKLQSGVDLVRIEEMSQSCTPIVIMGVDGDNRFALEDGTLTHNCGSPLWMSPEMIKNEPYDGKADVYSFAIVLWELYTRRVPYRALNLSPSQLVVKVVRDGLRPDIPKDCPRKLVRLLQSCWHRDAAQRPSFAAILKTLEGFLADKAMLRHKPGEKWKAKSSGSSAVAAATDEEQEDDGGDEDEAGGAPTDELQSAFELLVGASAGDKTGEGWMVDSKEVEVSNVRLLSEAEQSALGTTETSVVEDGSIQPLLLHTVPQAHPLSSPTAVAAAPIVGLSPSVTSVAPASSAASSRASSRLDMALKLRAHRVYRAKFRGRAVIVKKCTLDSARSAAASSAAPAVTSVRMGAASSTVQLSSFGSAVSDDVSIPSDLTEQVDQRALHTLLSRAASLRHPNLVMFMAAYIEFDHVGIVEEDVARGSLSRILADPSITIEWDQSLQFLIDAASALNYLALSGVGGGVHPDLRTSRLLVTSNWRVKLSGCAFTNLDRKLAILAREAGAATKTSPSSPNGPVHNHSGSLSTLRQQDSTSVPLVEADVSFWTAPECFDDDPAPLSSAPAAAASSNRAMAASVYSFSLIMWHVVSRSLPYAGKSGGKLRAKIKDGLRLPIPSSLSPKFRALIKSCWASDPLARPSFSAILLALQQIKREGPPRIVLGPENSRVYRKAATVFAHASRDELTILKDWGRNRGQKGDMIIAASSSPSAASSTLPSAGPALAAFHASFTLYLCDSRVFAASYEPTGRFDHEYRKSGVVRAKRMEEAFAIRTGGGGGEGSSTVELAAAAAAAAASSSLYPPPSFPAPTSSSPVDSPSSLLIVEQGNAGDYIVQNERGDQWCVEGKVMERSYALVEEEQGNAEAAVPVAVDASSSSPATPAASKLARPSISSRVPPQPQSQAQSTSASAPPPVSLQLVGLGGGNLVQASPSASASFGPSKARSGHKQSTTTSSKKPSKRVADSSAQ